MTGNDWRMRAIGVGIDGDNDNADASAVDTGVLNMSDALEEDELASGKLNKVLDDVRLGFVETHVDAFVAASQSMLAILRFR